MLKQQILKTIRMAHQFNSMYTIVQLYQLLPFRISYEELCCQLNQLEKEDKIYRSGEYVYCQDLFTETLQQQRWSRAIFDKYRWILKFLLFLPWVKFTALTGANSFESCKENDDIDLFVITAEHRLWLCYLLIVCISKLFRIRSTLCVNYLIDETHLEIPEHTYYNAVQITQMIPLNRSSLTRLLLLRNPWIYSILPNAPGDLIEHEPYLLKAESTKKKIQFRISLLDGLNRFIYQRYARRLAHKFPREFGKGIQLSIGRAKLNRIDHQHVYHEQVPDSTTGVPA